jgi:cyclopropane fatty-acyl-phospholipid synthase-like methyltransferase
MLKQEEQTRKKFNTLKKYYDETWDPKYHTLHVGFFGNEAKALSKAYEDAALNLIKKLNETSKITKSSIVLDIGCGTGRTLIYICEKYGCKGVGVDISDEMIKDAKKYLTEVNKNLKNKKLNIKFIRGSGSKLLNIFKKGEKFTHIISEDAIFLVVNKKSLFKNLYRLLIPGGALAIADFLSERPKKELTEKEENLIYKLVNWTEGLSFDMYQDILESVGFQNIQAEKRDDDMIKTYSILAKNLEKYVGSKDKTYRELQGRYENIVSAVKTGKMGWGLFFAKKPRRKQALLAGTNKKSIGRFIGNELYKNGWEIWLYGLHAKKIDKKLWHERNCDISFEKNILKLLDEIPDLDLVMFLADTERAKGDAAQSEVLAQEAGRVLEDLMWKRQMEDGRNLSAILPAVTDYSYNYFVKDSASPDGWHTVKSFGVVEGEEPKRYKRFASFPVLEIRAIKTMIALTLF